MIGWAMPTGANSPLRLPAIMPGNPASIAVGMSGAALMRVAALTASMRTFPAMELDERPAQVRRHQRDVAAGEIGDAGRGAFVRDVHDIGCADQLFVQLACKIG